MKQAAEVRHSKALAAKKRVHRKLQEDESFRVLYAAVALTFAEQLRQDLANLQAGRQVIQRPPDASFHRTWTPYMWRGLCLWSAHSQERACCHIYGCNKVLRGSRGQALTHRLSIANGQACEISLTADGHRSPRCAPSGRPRPSRPMTTRR